MVGAEGTCCGTACLFEYSVGGRSRRSYYLRSCSQMGAGNTPHLHSRGGPREVSQLEMDLELFVDVVSVLLKILLVISEKGVLKILVHEVALKVCNDR